MTSSVEAQAPPCPHFMVCGGCSLQHLANPLYEETKVALVKEALKHRDISAASLAPAVFLPPRTRRRITLKAFKKQKSVILGYLKQKSHEIVDIAVCPVVRPEIEALLEPLRGFLNCLLKDRQKIELALTITEGGIDLGLRGLQAHELTLDARETIATFAKENDLARISLFSGDDWEPLLVRTSPTVSFGAYRVAVSPGAFLQASREADKALLEIVSEGLLRQPKTIFDLFCGRGTFSLPLSEKAHVTAVDADPEALNALSDSIKRYQRPITVLRRNLFTDPLTVKEFSRADTVILNPPRDGAYAQVKTLSESTVGRVIMVSCRPQTFARDLKILINGGYVIQKITPVDQFIWSNHIECVGILEKS